MSIAPPTLLTSDLPCFQCRYNLRALPADGNCPECGTPIAQSLAARDSFHFVDHRKLAFGAALLAQIALPSYFFNFVSATIPLPGFVMGCLSLFTMLTATTLLVWGAHSVAMS